MREQVHPFHVIYRGKKKKKETKYLQQVIQYPVSLYLARPANNTRIFIPNEKITIPRRTNLLNLEASQSRKSSVLHACAASEPASKLIQKPTLQRRYKTKIPRLLRNEKCKF